MTEFSNFSVVAFDENMPFYWAYRAILLVIYYLMFLEVIFKKVTCIIMRICQSPFARKITASRLQADSKMLSKIPKHLGIIINEDQISFADIAKIIVWCITMNISCITVYDANGLCKRSRSIIQHEIFKENKQFALDQYTNIRFIVDNKDDASKSGPSLAQSLVRLLSLDDGRSKLTKITRQVCHKVNHNQMKLQDISTDRVDQLLREKEALCDPDLAFVFGPGQSLVGFRPWHLRLTEILFYDSHLSIDYPTFHQLLQRYNLTVQRHGK